MKRKKKNSIDLAIITSEPFPEGMAATNRILSYAKYLSKIKKVTVFISKPTEISGKVVNKDNYGFIDNLKFTYSLKTTVWPADRKKVYKLFFLLKSFLFLCVKLIQARPKSIIIYSSSYLLRSVVLILSKKTGTKVFVEENEYPKRLKIKSDGFFTKFYLSQYKNFDGLITMTTELKEYYTSIGVNQIFILPMTVDIERFKILSNDTESPYGKYFCYVGGNGGMERDGLLDMIYGFQQFVSSYPEYRFLIVGPLEDTSDLFESAKNVVNEFKIENKVVFLGSKNKDEVTNILMKSTGIVMAPQANFISGGFPTKLGEFLASGRPVVLTDVSEISDYLSISNSYLVSAGDNELLAKAMTKIVENPIEASRIGSNGRIVAESFFCVEKYTPELLLFLKV